MVFTAHPSKNGCVPPTTLGIMGLGEGAMRLLRRCLLVAGAVALLSLVPVAASANEMYLGIRNVDCSGVTVSGSGLPSGTHVTVTLLDGANRRPLERRALTTSASGGFVWRARMSLSGLRTVRAVVARAGAGTPIAWTDHQVPTACPLVNTGAGPVLPLVGMGVSSVVLGLLLLTVFAYRGRHLGLYHGRHVAVR
jgi:hypothetical protein